MRKNVNSIIGLSAEASREPFGGAANASSTTQQQFLKDVLVQFAKMNQNEQSLLSNLQLLANNAVLASQHF
ncbi:AGAP011638-PA-like protein [Anopheles sinensis]|uniref:AGAP011638-PA-like protein n=1 Tax=Anopheles sinensis TaxID=74873 RepID=A0A084VIA0_ANOSI|nr:AGAP011638-PA-like protein [Anopheles sinensis]